MVWVLLAGMGKIEGNIMIDVSPSNFKLLDRATRILKYLIELEMANSKKFAAELSTVLPYALL